MWFSYYRISMDFVYLKGLLFVFFLFCGFFVDILVGYVDFLFLRFDWKIVRML